MLTAERTYKLESGPPPLTWERYSELVRRDWRDLLDSAEHHDEAIFQKFLETHPCMVPGGQSMSGPSGHSAFPAAMITQPSLPGFSEHIPDFLWIATDSLHIYAVLVEIESPKKKMFTKGGQPTAQFTQAQNQITHWKSWFRDASNQRLFCDHYLMDGLPRWRTFVPQYVLIYGRRSEIEGNARLNGLRANLSRDGEYYMTFDRLHPIKDHDQYMTVKFRNGGYQAVSMPATLEMGPLWAPNRSRIEGKDLIVDSTPHMADDRKEFVKSRLVYWDKWAADGRTGMMSLGDRE
ncbi:Shedu anti-phage system protein SduA domain-containing protein [Rhizobium leguminosarum]|uniref:Shedu anti-phage system protein SduA domain-containing protein n=1 Tax=Rhizobium leguminosarum TaxID=384 RepID=UPI003F9749A2